MIKEPQAEGLAGVAELLIGVMNEDYTFSIEDLLAVADKIRNKTDYMADLMGIEFGGQDYTRLTLIVSQVMCRDYAKEKGLI